MHISGIWKKKCYRQSYLQSRNRDTDIENKYMDTKGRGVGGIERLRLTYIHCVLCRFSRVQLLTTQWAVAGQTPLSMGFSRQGYWSKLSCPPPWDLPPGIEATSLMSPALAGRFFTTSATWEAHIYTTIHKMWETRVRSLGREDPLEKEMAAHSSSLAWKIPWTEEPGGLQSMGSQRVGHDWATPPPPPYIKKN